VVYQNTKRFLKNRLDSQKQDVAWEEYNKEFFAYLASKHSAEDIEENKSEIKVAFADFYAEHFRTMVLFRDKEQLVLRLMPYQLAPSMSRHLPNLIRWVEELKESIEKEGDTLKLSGKLRRKINEEIADSDELVNKSEVIKLAIKTALGLSDEDIIVPMKRTILIHLASGEEGEDEAAQLDEKQLEALCKKTLTFEAIELIIEAMIEEALKTKLNFATLSQGQYEKSVLAVFKYGIADALTKNFKLPDAYVLALSTYLLRTHFSTIYLKFTEQLLRLLTQGDQAVKAFLSRYNGELIVENNLRYKMPIIEGKEGRRWNTMMMSVIAKTWFTNYDKFQEVTSQLERYSYIYDNFSRLNEEVARTLEKCKIDASQINSKLIKISNEIQNCTTQLNVMKLEKKDIATQAAVAQKKSQFQNIYQSFSKNLAELEQEYKTQNQERIKLKEQYKSAEQNIRGLEKQKRQLTAQLEQYEAGFSEMIEAVATALAKRKQPYKGS